MSAQNIVEVVDDIATISKVDATCSSTNNESDVDVTRTLDLGVDDILIEFNAEWVNNDLGEQGVLVKGDGFKVVVYSLDDDGGRVEEPGVGIWNTYIDYFAEDDEKQYFESESESLIELGDTSDTPATYDCNNVNGRADEDEVEGASLPKVYIHSVGELIVVESNETVAAVPQSETIPATRESLWGEIPYRSGAGGYFWWGFDLNGDEVPVDTSYEADVEVTICLTDEGCEALIRTFKFKLVEKVVTEETT